MKRHILLALLRLLFATGVVLALPFSHAQWGESYPGDGQQSFGFIIIFTIIGLAASGLFVGLGSLGQFLLRRRPARFTVFTDAGLFLLFSGVLVYGGVTAKYNEGHQWNGNWAVQWQMERSPIVFRSYSFSPDSRHFAAVDLSRKVVVYETLTGSVIASWDSGQTKAFKAIYDPSGQRLATTGMGPTVKVWDLNTHQQVSSLDADDLKTTGYCWSPDGTTLMAYSTHEWNGEIILWDAMTMRQVASLRGHSGAVSGVGWHPQGGVIVSTGHDGTLRVWDEKTFLPLKVFHEHADKILCMAFSADGKYLATGGLRSGGLFGWEEHKNLLIWDTSNWKVIHRVDNAYNVMGLRYQPGGTQFTALDGYYMRLWDPASGRYLGKIRRAGYAMDTAVYSPDSRHAITLDYTDPSNQVLRVWRAPD